MKILTILNERLAQIEAEFAKHGQNMTPNACRLDGARQELQRLREILIQVPQRPNFANLKAVPRE